MAEKFRNSEFPGFPGFPVVDNIGEWTITVNGIRVKIHPPKHVFLFFRLISLFYDLKK